MNYKLQDYDCLHSVGNPSTSIVTVWEEGYLRPSPLPEEVDALRVTLTDGRLGGIGDLGGLGLGAINGFCCFNPFDLTGIGRLWGGCWGIEICSGDREQGFLEMLALLKVCDVSRDSLKLAVDRLCLRCELTKCPAVKADIRESSPANTVAQTSRAKVLEFVPTSSCAPLTFNIAKQAD